jgi:hypothetical protein
LLGSTRREVPVESADRRTTTIAFFIVLATAVLAPMVLGRTQLSWTRPGKMPAATPARGVAAHSPTITATVLPSGFSENPSSNDSVAIATGLPSGSQVPVAASATYTRLSGGTGVGGRDLLLVSVVQVPAGTSSAIAGPGNDRTVTIGSRTVILSTPPFGGSNGPPSIRARWNEAGKVTGVIAVGVTDDELTHFIDGLVIS